MEFLTTILKMSLTGSIIFFIYLLIRPLTKMCFNSSWHYYLLIMILIFFIAPVGSFINPSINIIPDLSPKLIQKSGDLDKTVISVDKEDINSPQNIDDTDGIEINQYEDKAQKEEISLIENENFSPNRKNFNINLYKDMIFYIWIGGMVILFLLKVIPYIRFKSAIARNSIEVNDKDVLELFDQSKEKLNISSKLSLKICNSISSPMLIGAFNPTILIPNIDEDPKTMGMIFLHELNHFKRKDIIIKYFGFIVNLIHWFNPIIYILLKKVDLYSEYSIDEKVVDKMGIEDRKYYGQIILNAIDNSIARSKTFTTAMSSEGKELKSRLENMLFAKKGSRSKKIVSLFSLILILVSGFTVACNIMPSKGNDGNDSLAVYIKEDGLYYSYLNREDEEIKIHDGISFEYPLISKSGDYIAYTKEDNLYIYNIKEEGYEKIADEIGHYYTSYDWIDNTNIIYGSDKKPGFVILNVSTKEKQEHLDEYYYIGLVSTSKNIVYGTKWNRWTIEERDFIFNEGIVEINLNKYDEKGKTFPTNIIIEGRKSTDEMIGYNPIVWDITEDGKYIYIMEKPASGSLSTDGIGIGIYDVEKKTHTELTNIVTLHYKNHLAINPKNNNLIGLIEGAGREMLEDKEVVLFDIDGNGVNKSINFMDRGLVAMTPSFTLNGERLLFSATKNVVDNEYEQWHNQPHNIYEYNLKTSVVKKVTEGEHFDFMPINISNDEILFSRYKGNNYYSLIKLVNGKEDIIADNIVFRGGSDNYPYVFYGHIKTEKGLDVFINQYNK